MELANRITQSSQSDLSGGAPARAPVGLLVLSDKF